MIRRQHEAIAKAEEFLNKAVTAYSPAEAQRHTDIAMVYAELAKALKP